MTGSALSSLLWSMALASSSKLQKYPSDVSVIKNCNDVNFEMVERWDPDKLSLFPSTGIVRVDNAPKCP